MTKNLHKYIFIVLVLSGVFISASEDFLDRDEYKLMESSLVGVWTVDVDSAFNVEIKNVNGVFEGTVVWLRDSINGEGQIKKDVLNPDPDLRSRTFKGIKVVNNMEFKNSGLYCCGELYDPESGKTYQCRITLPSPNVANIRGFIGIPLLGKTVVFRRVPR